MALQREVWQSFITDSSGNVQPGAQITVFDAGTSNLSTIYSSLTGAPRSNPFNAGSDGLARFYAEPARYRIQAQVGSYIAVFDDVDLSQKALRDDLSEPDGFKLVGGLSNAATRAVQASVNDATAGRVLTVGAFGLGRGPSSPSVNVEYSSFDDLVTTGYFYASGVSAANAPTNAGSFLVDVFATGGQNNNVVQRATRDTATESMRRTFYRNRNSGVWSSWSMLYDTVNTTVDSNGFIKQASPIINLYDDKAEPNSESGSVDFEKVGTGHYELTGVQPLASEGWYIETPKDRNGNVYFTLDYVQEDGKLIIKTYDPDYSSGRAENGAPMDIIEGRFVSLRFKPSPQEPEDGELIAG